MKLLTMVLSSEADDPIHSSGNQSVGEALSDNVVATCIVFPHSHPTVSRLEHTALSKFGSTTMLYDGLPPREGGRITGIQ